MKDQISRLETRISEADNRRQDMEKKLDHMYDILIEYISKSK
jgi:predicted  nucleic acid-binding Zn-ribbon protein